MSKFVLTAQLQLQPPKNVAQVVRQLQGQLNNVHVNIQAKGAQQAQKSVQQLSGSLKSANKHAGQLGDSLNISVRRFAGLAIATRAVSLFTNTLGGAVKGAIDFERQLVKISQVTGKTMGNLRDLTNEITRLSSTFGVAADSLLNVSRVLSQAGLNANQTRVALSALAKSDLAPTFDDITQTAEGAVAIFNQFKKGAGALEGQLGSLNAVAGQFAVEAGDLIAVIRRTGGVFKQAGGDLNELIALFTSVRSTTRESAESIATGLRTIFTRIQRPETIKYLKQFGVQLTDLEGKFIGPYKAVGELNKALAGLEEGDLRFVEIAEQLGGFRQIGKVLPLIKEYSVAQRALAVAQAGSNSLAEDAAKAQQTLAVRIQNVAGEFAALIRSVSETSTFQLMANSALALASALIKIGDAVKPLIPLLGALAAVKLVKGMSGMMGGLSGAVARGGAQKFASGGMVPGSGNSDTVPAMLTPGEFVIKKSSVKKLGASNLQRMNNNKYARGGKIKAEEGAIGGFFLRPEQGEDTTGKIKGKYEVTNASALQKLGKLSSSEGSNLNAYARSLNKDRQLELGLIRNKSSNKYNPGVDEVSLGSAQGKKSDKFKIVQKAYKEDLKSGKAAVKGQQIPFSGNITGFFPGEPNSTTPQIAKLVTQQTERGLRATVKATVSKIKQQGLLSAGVIQAQDPKTDEVLNNLFVKGGAGDTVEGFVNEGIISAISGAKMGGAGTLFDYPSSSLKGEGVKDKLQAMFGGEMSKLVKADAKRTSNSGTFESIAEKLVGDINKGNFEGTNLAKMAAGGPVGTDTVPALLTPGEFVVNRASAKRIGYGSLNRMNKVGKYADGGVVQKFANGTSGTGVQPMGSPGSIPGMGKASSNLQILANSSQQASQSTNKVTQSNNQEYTASQKLMGGVIALGTGMAALRPNVEATSGAFATGTAAFMDGMLAVAAQATFVATALEALGVKANLQNFKGLFDRTGQSRVMGKIGGAARGAGERIAGRFGAGPEQAAAFGQKLGTAAQAITPYVAALGTSVAAISILNSAIETFYNYTQRLNKAVTEGDIEGAGAAGAGQAGLETGNNARMIAGAAGAAIGTAMAGPLGTVIGGIVGTAIGTITTAIGGFFGANSAAKRLAEANAATASTMNNLEKDSKEAAKSLQAFKDGNGTAIDSLDKFQNTFSDASQNLDRTSGYATAKGDITTKDAVEAQQNSTLFAAGRNLVAYSGGGMFGMETNATRNERLKAQGTTRAKSLDAAQKSVSAADPSIQILMRQSANAGKSLEEFKQSLAANSKSGKAYLETIKQLDAATENGKGASEELAQKFKNIAEEAERTRAAIEAMSLGMAGVNGAANATAMGLNNFLSSQEAGYSGLQNSLSVLENGVTGAANNISTADFNSALGNASDTLKGFGATNDQIQKFEANMKGVNAVQQQLPKSFETARGELQAAARKGIAAGGTGTSQKDAVVDVLVKDIKSMNLGAEVEKNILAGINNMDLSQGELEQIELGNFDVLEQKISDIGGKQLEQVRNAIEKQIEMQKKLNAVVARRLELEDQYVKAQQRGIGMILEMQEIQAKHGGAAVSPAMREQAAIDAYNVESEQAGVVGVANASPDQIRRNIQDTRAELGRINSTRMDAAGGGTGLEGEAGVNLEKQQQRLNNLLKSQYDLTKNLISIKQQELTTIKEKNKLERDAMDALIGGDVNSFMDNMATQAAQAAIATGDTSAMNMMGGQALGRAAQENKRLQDAGVTELYGQKLAGPGGMTERGFQAVADNVGIVDPNFARASAGTTLEENKLNTEIRDLAANFTEIKDGIVEAAKGDLEVGKAIESGARKLMTAGEVLKSAGEALGGSAVGEEGAGAGGAAGAKRDATVTAQTANINAGNVNAGGGGGGGITGGVRSIAGLGGNALAKTGMFARNATLNTIDAATPYASQAASSVSRAASGARSSFQTGRAGQRAIAGGFSNVGKPSGLVERGGRMFERLNQASLGADFNPSMSQRARNLYSSSGAQGYVDKALSMGDEAVTSFKGGKLGLTADTLSRSGKPSLMNRASNTAGLGARKVGQNKLVSGALDRGRTLANKVGGYIPKVDTSKLTGMLPEGFLANAGTDIASGARSAMANAPGFLSQAGTDIASGAGSFMKGARNLGGNIAGSAGGKLVSGLATKGVGKGLLQTASKGSGLGTALDAGMEAYAWASDPSKQHEKYKRMSGRGFSGTAADYGLETGTSLDAATGTLMGGVEGFLSPVGKITEGVYTGAGTVADTYGAAVDSAKTSRMQASSVDASGLNVLERNKASQDSALQDQLAMAGSNQEREQIQSRIRDEEQGRRNMRKQDRSYFSAFTDTVGLTDTTADSEEYKAQVAAGRQTRSASTAASGAIPAAAGQAGSAAQPSVGAPAGLDPEVMSRFSASLEKFNTDLSANIDRLANTKLEIKLADANVSVNINDGGLLQKLNEMMGDTVNKKIEEKLAERRQNPDGSQAAPSASQLG